MRAFLGTCFVGSFAFDADGNLIDKELFPKRIDTIAERIKKSREGEVLPEEREIIHRLISRGFKEIIWDKRAEIDGIGCVYKKDNPAEKALQGQFRNLAIELRWVSSHSELNEILSKVQIELTKKELKKEKKDFMIMRVIGVIDELDKNLNTLSELLREWYGLHFPEMGRLVGSNEKFAEIIAEHGSREGIDDRKLREIAEKSSGMPLSGEDAKQLQDFAAAMVKLFEEKKALTKYLENLARKTIPNLSATAGPALAARLLALAGGLDKMSKLPSSTVQLLGAEKALFRHLRGEGKSPKYGVLFGHGYVQNAPKELKGKVARMVASKITLAARLDRFSDKDSGEKLRSEMEEQLKRIRSGRD